MADGSGQAIDDRFLIFVDMAMAVGDAMLMLIFVIVLMLHIPGLPSSFFAIIPYFAEKRKPRRGMEGRKSY
jgi:hypothetical protein